MHGSLVCFTNNNFETIIFGKILDNRRELLREAQITVQFDTSPDLSYDEDYLMVECNVYFEPYYHVLNALQKINAKNFPMDRYIIRVEKEVSLPTYLLPNTKYTIDGNSVDMNSWPDDLHFDLNVSQYTAFKAGLTREFALIQGPPGTGKTYVGLKIVKTLLKNTSVWHKGSPILIVCYTNHALDQFLEGLLDVTKSILRIGGQCKNEHLKQFNIAEKHKTVKICDCPVNSTLKNKRRNVENILSDINNCNTRLDLIQRKMCIADIFSCFCEVDEELHASWFNGASSTAVEEWLFGNSRSFTKNRSYNNLQKVRQIHFFFANVYI